MKKMIMMLIVISVLAIPAFSADIAAIQKHIAENGSWAICEEWHEIDPILRAVFVKTPYEVTQLVIAPRESGGSQKACVAVRKK